MGASTTCGSSSHNTHVIGERYTQIISYAPVPLMILLSFTLLYCMLVVLPVIETAKKIPRTGTRCMWSC